MTEVEKICELQTKVVEYEHLCRLLACLLSGRDDVQEDFVFLDKEVEGFYDILYNQICKLLIEADNDED